VLALAPGPCVPTPSRSPQTRTHDREQEYERPPPIGTQACWYALLPLPTYGLIASTIQYIHGYPHGPQPHGPMGTPHNRMGLPVNDARSRVLDIQPKTQYPSHI
jgi:hypothetical protein